MGEKLIDGCANEYIRELERSNKLLLDIKEYACCYCENPSCDGCPMKAALEKYDKMTDRFKYTDVKGKPE